MTAPPQDQPVDGVDESDLDAMEIAMGVAVTALLVAWLMPGPPSIFGRIVSARRAQVESQVGPVVRAFIQRSASDLASASRQPGAHVAAAEIEPAVYDRVMGVAAQWLEDSYSRVAGSVGTSGGDQVGVDESEVRRLTRVAGEQTARALASYARNEARDETAGRIGALWSIWASRHDSRVRDSHQDLDGQKVPFGGRFVVGNGRAYLRFPGDPEGPPSETMGCRCRLKYRFRPRETSYAEV